MTVRTTASMVNPARRCMRVPVRLRLPIILTITAIRIRTIGLGTRIIGDRDSDSIGDRASISGVDFTAAGTMVAVGTMEAVATMEAVDSWVGGEFAAAPVVADMRAAAAGRYVVNHGS